jgi:TonB family protein
MSKNDGPVAVDAQPVPTFQVRPHFPKEMIEQKVRGEVLVDFVVGEDGGVYSANVIRQTNDQFGLAAVACVTQWRFKPGLKAGIAVKTHLQVPIIFELQDEKENQPKATNGL